jgi:hypothetical protein
MSVDYFKPYYVCEIKVTHFPAITGIYLVMSGINLSVKKKVKKLFLLNQWGNVLNGICMYILWDYSRCNMSGRNI